MDLILFLGTVIAFFIAVGWLVAGPLGSIAGLFVSLIVLLILFLKSDNFILKITKAKFYENKDLEKMLEQLTHETRLKIPKLYIISSKLPNAFSLGTRLKNSAIVITQGLLDLKKEEIKIVLAHEIAHIKRRDTQVASMSTALSVLISYPAQMNYFILPKESNKQKRFLQGFIISLFALPAIFVIRVSTSKIREFRADWTGSLINKNPEIMASAIRNITRLVRKKQMIGFAATSNLWFINPFQQTMFNHQFNAHPITEKRLERLEVLKSF